MSVFKYEQENRIYYGARVHRRSKLDHTIRIQKERRGFHTESEARRAMRNLEAIVLREITLQESSDISLIDLLGEWEIEQRYGRVSGPSVQPTTIEDRVQSLRIHFASHLHKPAEIVSRADVYEALLAMKQKGKSISRQKQLISSINGIYRWGIDTRRIKRIANAPSAGISLKREVEKKPPILNRTEILKLLDAARSLKHRWYPVWATAVLTGARSGELFALTWNDVDFEDRRITISKSYNGRMKAIKCTKAGYWRDVPINDELITLLRELRASSQGRIEVFPRLPRWSHGEQARILRAFCIGIGITPITFHALRACFATQLLRNGVSAAVIQKMCGWAELKTMQRYIRLAGVEVEGATSSLCLITPEDAIARVISLSEQPKIGVSG